jgi:hypothetical protein
MSESKYILKRNWQSTSGEQEVLYLGYSKSGIIDCVSDKIEAKVMTKEDAEAWKLILLNGHIWSIEELEEPVKELKENADDESQIDNSQTEKVD